MGVKFTVLTTLAQKFPDKFPEMDRIMFILRDEDSIKISELNLVCAGDVEALSFLFRRTGLLSFRYSGNVVYDEPLKIGKLGDIVPDQAFRGSSLRAVDLTGVRKIGTSAFNYSYYLTSAKFSKGLESIGDFAFHSCSRLKGVRLPSTLECIGDEAFRYCESFRVFRVPDKVHRLGCKALADCSSLRKVALGSGITELEAHMFSGSRVKELYINGAVNVVPQYLGFVNDIKSGVKVYVDNISVAKQFAGRGYSEVYRLNKSPWF